MGMFGLITVVEIVEELIANSNGHPEARGESPRCPLAALIFY